jgi:cob(I)alamin adenosyltransferase
VARCVCRQAERLAVALEAEEANVPELVAPYLNRLSDFLFTLCRLPDASSEWCRNALARADLDLDDCKYTLE